jgi:DNA adenine methylase
MVGYCGGKVRIGKEIAKVMHAHVGLLKFDTYVEPFCGMCGVMRHVNANERRGSDIVEDLIVLWQGLQNGYDPTSTPFSREAYYELKGSPSSLERTFAGYTMCYGGVYFGGFFPNGSAAVCRRSLLQLTRNCADVKFTCESYDKLRPHNAVVYCDPPYQNHHGFHKLKFNHAQFWDTMREWSRDNIVFVSETTAPDDWQSIWEKETISSMWTRSDGITRTRSEKLYVYCPP